MNDHTTSALQQTETEIPATPEHSGQLKTASQTKPLTAIQFREAKTTTPPRPKHSTPSEPKAPTPPPHPQPGLSVPSASVDVPPPSSIRSPSARPQLRMGSNIGGDSCSDTETQEPTKPVMPKTPVHVEDSDVEEPTTVVRGGSPDSSDGKMRQIIERINADSDRSDDEEQVNEEEEVDFGDEVEEDMVVDVDEKVKEAEMKEEGKTKGKGKKKEKEAPVKTIKKADAKGKSKGGKGKGSALVKKKEAAAKEKAGSRNGSPKTSPKPEKKTASRVNGKGTAKADAKPRAKAVAKSSADKEKAVKPKKTISKEDKKTAKKPLLKKNEKKTGAVKTFSKKANAATAKSSPKGKKAATPKKAKKEKAIPVKNTKKSKKPKATATPSKSSEDDDSMVVADSEDEANTSDSEEEMEETARTPGSKLPILGNLACSSRDANASALLDHAVQQLGKYNVVSYGPDSDCDLHAYVIGKETKRGWGLLQALASGVPLVSEDWLSSSISEGKWKPMDVFRSDRFGQSPRSVDATAQQTGILDGQRVKVVSDNKDVASIRKLLCLCGARVAETRMDVVINDTGKPAKGCVNVSKKWLADSVEAGEPLDYDAYVMSA